MTSSWRDRDNQLMRHHGAGGGCWGFVGLRLYLFGTAFPFYIFFFFFYIWNFLLFLRGTVIHKMSNQWESQEKPSRRKSVFCVRGAGNNGEWVGFHVDLSESARNFEGCIKIVDGSKELRFIWPVGMGRHSRLIHTGNRADGRSKWMCFSLVRDVWLSCTWSLHLTRKDKKKSQEKHQGVFVACLSKPSGIGKLGFCLWTFPLPLIVFTTALGGLDSQLPLKKWYLGGFLKGN